MSIRRRSPATDLAEANAAADRPVVQVRFPFAAEDPAPTPQPQNPRTAWTVGTMALLEDLALELEEIALDREKPCRCLNQASCRCDGSTLVRKYRRKAQELLPRVRALVTPSLNKRH